MAHRSYLSEFEQLVMLAVMQLEDDAYGARIRQVLAASARRPVSIATIYVALDRLAGRGLVRSEMSEPIAVRGGRSRRVFSIAPAGVAALKRSRDTIERMWAEAGVATGRRPKT